MEILMLVGLILANGALAMCEVALLTASRPRLAARARQGDRLAAAALDLAAQPTRFLSTIQIGITSIGILNGIIGEAVFAAPLSRWIASFNVSEATSAFAATAIVVAVVTYVSIVAGELIPKRLGQLGAEQIARFAAWPMRALAAITSPFVKALAVATDPLLRAILAVLRIRREGEGPQPLSIDEVRTLVLESSNVLPAKHMSILLNLFDLEGITVRDVMVPRARIESIRLDEPIEDVLRQLTTAYHMRLPVFRDRDGELAGILHLRKVLDPLRAANLDRETLTSLVSAPYFVPPTTSLLSQLQFFQEQKERLAIVVDEYGELIGLVTLEDIIEEIIGKFTTTTPSGRAALSWDGEGGCTVSASASIRDVNRALGLSLPVEGPRTLNGLLLEHLQDIPEANVSVRIGGVSMEIIQVQDRAIHKVRLFRPPRGPLQASPPITPEATDKP